MFINTVICTLLVICSTEPVLSASGLYNLNNSRKVIATFAESAKSSKVIGKERISWQAEKQKPSAIFNEEHKGRKAKCCPLKLSMLERRSCLAGLLLQGRQFSVSSVQRGKGVVTQKTFGCLGSSRLKQRTHSHVLHTGGIIMVIPISCINVTYIHTYQVTSGNLICNHGPKELTQCAKHSAQSWDVGHSVFPFKFFKLD